MHRYAVCLFAVLCFASASSVVSADIRSDQRVRFQLGGAVGKLINMFGGKGAREGVTTTVAVKGNRKATLSDTTGQIVDLSEEKVYDLDIKKKTYKVTTFAQLRAEMEKARREAEQMAREEQQQSREPNEPSKPAEKDPNQDRKSTRLNSSHSQISYAVFCLKKKKKKKRENDTQKQKKTKQTPKKS